MDASVIISSYNQKNRLFFCLDSISKQITNYKYEIVLADDNSNDGTLEMVQNNFPNVIISKNLFSEKNTYTLADNWNTATKLATGKRFIFSNADIVFCKHFIDAHLDPIMSDSIIFGPSFNTEPGVVDFLHLKSAKELVDFVVKHNLIGNEKGHSEGSAETYNKIWDWRFPFGYNFSVLSGQFFGVGGFPRYKRWGGEDNFLCKKIVDKYGTKVKSNKNAYSLHLWHPIVNDRTTDSRIDDINF